jgi:hypothetical protein
VNARREWAAHLIQRGGPDIPIYGSPEFLALPEGSPAKIGSVVRAAEAWAMDGDQLEERLRLEVLALSRANKIAEDAEYVASYQRPTRTLPDAAELEAEFWDWIRGAA